MIYLPDLHDTSDVSHSGGSISSKSSSSLSPDQHDEQPLLQEAELEPPVNAEQYVESDPEDAVPADLIKGKPDFRKYLDQIREELLIIFIPEIMIPPIEHFPSHVDLKMTFARILRAARIYKKREIDDIIVSA